MGVEMVSVDKDVLDFLKTILFGVYDEPFSAASFRAYRDFNRTIPLKESGIIDAEERETLRNTVTEILRRRIAELLNKQCDSQDDFDAWHFTTATAIRDYYRTNGVPLTYGHTQKWLNMTLKYLYIIEPNDYAALVKFFHPPLDKYIFEIAESELGIQKFPLAWSKWDDYDSMYMKYQRMLREHVHEKSLFRWEFQSWNKQNALQAMNKLYDSMIKEDVIVHKP